MKNTLFQSALKLSILFTIVFLIVSNADAAGVFDRTFGTNGRVSTDVGGFAQANAVTVQPDGKILVLGTSGAFANTANTILIRYNANGSLDSGFGNGGIVVANLSAQYEVAYDLALHADGKIVVAGSIYSATTQSVDFSIARFNTDGSRDTTFGTNGIATANQGSTDDFNAVAVQPDGKIIAAGRTSDGDRYAVVRFNSNGTLDGSFADSGLLFRDIGGFSQETVYTLNLLPNGRILLGGKGSVTVPHAGTSNFLAVINSNGSSATDFGTNGTVVFWDGFVSPGFDAAVLPDGRILVVSDRTYRFLPNGIRDTSFTGGNAGSELAVRSDGKFVIGGNFVSNNATQIYTPDGRLIGRARNLPAGDIAIGANNKIIIISSTGNNFEVTRLDAITSRATRLADFEPDDKTDLIVYRPSNRTFYMQPSQGGNAVIKTASAPVSKTIPEAFNIPRSDFVYFNAPQFINSQAYFYGEFDTSPGEDRIAWGITGDIAVGGDYDGDGYTEFTVFRPQNGTWYARLSSNNQFSAIQWGVDGDKPVPADYDYDGITDFAVYRPSTGTWWIRRSSDGGASAIRWGIASDIPLTGDFDGDGRADLTVYRASEGNWYQLLTTEGFRVVRFGISTDAPVPGDYDGDGRHDVAVFRAGVWYILQSTAGLKIVQWGVSGDVPVAVRYDQ